jgi:hypothetical protein
MADAFGRALLDHYRGERDAALYQRDGDARKRHPVEGFYFGDFADQPGANWIASQIDGPLLDVGAGAGRDALYFQTDFETTAIEISDALVTLLAERGVADARQGDMFALEETVERERFRSVLIAGTQLGLARSMAGLRDLLADLAAVTTSGATAVVDAYDPTYEGADGMLGFRSDPTPGLAFRVVNYEYADLVGDTLLFRLFAPDRLREATDGTEWHVAATNRPRDAYYYQAALRKA